MIRVYTKTRHVDSIHKFLHLINLEHEIFTTKNPPSPEHEFEPFDLGVSYSYPRKITKNLLSIPSKGTYNKTNVWDKVNSNFEDILRIKAK